MVVDWLKRVPKFSLAGGTALGLVVLSFVITTTRAQDSTRHNCQQLELVKSRIRLVIKQSLATAGKPGAPGYQYYLSHPVELVQARAGLRQELVQFAANPC